MYFSEWLIVYSYARSIYKRRNNYGMLVTVFLYAVLLLTYKFITQMEILNLLFTLMCNIFCFYFGFYSTFKSSAFHGLILTITQFVSEVIAIYMISFVSNSANDSYKENDIIYITDVIISKIIYFAISRFLLRFSNRENSAKSWGRWFSLSILPASSLFIIIVIRLLTNGQHFSFLESALCILSLSVLLIANIVIYLIYERAEKSNQKLIELELANQKNDTDMQYLSLLEKKNEAMNIMAHDYKNNLLTIANMTDSGDIKGYIDNIVGDIKQYNQIAKTRNKWLDVIINKYTEICKDKKINFNTEIATDNLSFISSYDISSLFNNILDNAVEAAELSDEKSIFMEITNSMNSYHKIIVKNSCDFKPKSEKEKLITTKSNKEAHGFGTKSIHNVVKKYGGELHWEYDEEIKEFKLIILIPIEQ